MILRPLRISTVVTLFCLAQHASSFIEEILQQAFGGGGGGQQFHFQMGGHPQQRQQPKKVKFPKGVSAKIDDSFAWLKGTEWTWNNWRNVKFASDGAFEAPTAECQMPGQCRWSANKGHVFIMWGSAGLHRLTASQSPEKGLATPAAELLGITLEGLRTRDNEKCSATFVRIVDTEIRDATKDLYGTLGLEPDAPIDVIKKAYRRLSIVNHPDKNPGDPEAAAKFAAISEAHEILTDGTKKILYDTGGMEAIRASEKGEIQKGRDVQMELQIGLEQLYKGEEVNLKMDRRVVCTGCRSTPTAPRCLKCNRCPNEVKMVNQQVGPGFFVQQQQEVPSQEKCKNEKTEFEVHIERGASSGEVITFENMGEQRPRMIPGNVHFVLKQRPHSRFTREGDNLRTRIRIPLKEALLGFKRYFKHLDDHDVELDRTNQITRPFQVLSIENEGMPKKDHPSERGTLFVEVVVDMPTQLSDSQKSQLEDALPDSPNDPRFADEIRAEL